MYRSIRGFRLMVGALTATTLATGCADEEMAAEEMTSPAVVTHRQAIAPTASNLSASLSEDGSKSITLTGYDDDWEPLTFKVTTPPANGDLSPSLTTHTSGYYDPLGPDPRKSTFGVTYSPVANYSGPDSFTYEVSDGTNTATGTVSITVNTVNDAPLHSLPSNPSTDEETSLVFSAAGSNAITISDVDDDSVDVTMSVASHGTLTLGQTTNLTNLSGDGTAAVSFSGLLTDINAALDGLTFAPATNDDSDVTLSITTTDHDDSATGSTASQSDNLAITVTSVNDAPTASNDTASTNEDTPVVVDVLSNDNDVDSGDTKTIDSVTTPNFGSATIENGKITFDPETYEPGTGNSGTATFDYTMKDSAGATSTASVEVTVNNVNDAPVASAKGDTINEDAGAVSISFSATDDDGDLLSFTISDQPDHGTLSSLSTSQSGNTTTATATYTPDDNYNGSDFFTFVASDGTANDAANYTFTIDAVNDAPIASSGTLTVDEDSSSNAISFSGSDVDGQQLTFTIVSGPSHGTLISSLTPSQSGDVTTAAGTYTPDDDYEGSDSITFRVSDGTVTDDATVAITVNGVNDAPVASATSFTFDEDSSSNTVTFTADDADGQLLGMSVSSGPSNGTLSSISTSRSGNTTTATATYTPNADHAGIDSFTFVASDGTAMDNANVSLTISGANDAPDLALPGSQSVDEDGSMTFDASGSNAIAVSDRDADGGDMVFTASVSNATLTPSTTADLTVNGSGTGSLSMTGPMSAINAALDGLQLTPAAAYAGSLSISIAIDDQGNTGAGGSLSDSGSIDVTVSPVNDAPALTLPGAQSTNEDTDLSLTGISVADPDADGANLSLALAVNSGTLTLASTASLTVSGDGTGNVSATGPASALNTALNGMTYAPADNDDSSDTLSLSLDDNGNTGSGGALTDSGSIAIDLLPVNDAPVAENDSDTTDEDTAVVIDVLSNDSDVDSSSLSIESWSTPSFGTVTADTNGLKYMPASNFHGADTFDYVISDGSATASATVSITVSSVNDTPLAQDDSATVTEDTVASIDVLANDTDADNDDLTVSSVTQPAQGSAVIETDGTISFTPPASFTGTTSFEYTVSDGNGASATATVHIDTDPVNDAPMFNAPATATVDEDNGLVFSSANANEIRAQDIDAGTADMLMTLTVVEGRLSLGSSADLSFVIGDARNEQAISFFGSLANINAAMAGLTYTPPENYYGDDTITLEIDDQGNTGTGGALTASATIAVTVAAVNDAPVNSVPTAQELDEDNSLVFSDSDADSNAISVSDIDQPAALGVKLTVGHGKLTLASTAGLLFISGTGSDEASMEFVGAPADVNAALDGLTYAPDPDFHGSDELEIISDDDGQHGSGGALTDTDSVAIEVLSVNDTPTAEAQQLSTVEDTSIDITLSATDADGDSLTYTIVSDPMNGALGALNGDSVTYTPDANFAGSDSFRFEVSDGNTTSATAMVSISVNGTSDAPQFAPPTPSGKLEVLAERELTFTMKAVDADGDTISYDIQPMPAGATLDTFSGSFAWTPKYADAGSYDITLMATDGESMASRDLTIEVSFVDVDADSVPDEWEDEHDLDTSTDDSDGDTISDFHETLTFETPTDTDGDSIIDALDSDSDDDGRIDLKEAGDADLLTAPVDTDGDGMPDFQDSDSDDDGVSDDVDNCWRVANGMQPDSDGDGIGDHCETDTDGDGVSDELENSLGLDAFDIDTDGDSIMDGHEMLTVVEAADTDGDGIIDALDDDSDADGWLDIDEAGDDDTASAPFDTDEDGTPDFQDSDSDADGIDDGSDNCRLLANADQTDTDADGIGDVCVDDADGDGILDDSDNCPTLANPAQDDLDEDGQGDECDPDDDGDGTDDDADNCPATSNDQLDVDGDGAGDACDDDDDDDGVEDGEDNCPAVANAAQADADGDGLGDGCDADRDGDDLDNDEDACPSEASIADDGCPESDEEPNVDEEPSADGDVSDAGDSDRGCSVAASGSPDAGLLFIMLGLVLSTFSRRRRR